MDFFKVAFSVVMPLLIYMLVGAFIRRRQIFSMEQFKSLNKVIFRIFIPLTLFCEIYKSNITKVFRPSVFAFIAIAVLITFLISYLIFSVFVKDKAIRATVVQASYRSNYVLFGTTIAAVLCNENGMPLVAGVAAMVVPLYNILAVIIFEMAGSKKTSFSEILISIIKNPLVDAGVLGVTVNLLGVPIPDVIFSPLSKLGGIATPLALVVLGGLLSIQSIGKHWKYIIAASMVRLVLIPLVVITAAAGFGFRGEVMVTIFAVFASPTAVSSAPMAQSMGGDGMLAGEIVAATTVFSLVSIFVFVVGLLRQGLI